MRLHELLGRLHAELRPRNYLEIGVNRGRSLTLSSVPTIGIDPSFRVIHPVHCDLQLAKVTSDDFFARPDPLAHLAGRRRDGRPRRRRGRGRPRPPVLDLGLVDGLHHVEFALRDFINLERFAGPTSVIVLDDMLPRNVDEAARDRHTPSWTGDVFKLIAVLRELRPDLVLLPLDTEPTGVLVVIGADPTDAVLGLAHDELVERIVTPDPQEVPRSVLRREGAVDPEKFLASAIPKLVVRGRRPRRSARSLERIRAEAATLIGTAPVRPG